MPNIDFTKPDASRLNAAHLNDPANLYSLPVPFSRKFERELAGHKSTTIKISLDDPGRWPNYIFENSLYFATIFNMRPGTKMIFFTSLPSSWAVTRACFIANSMARS